MFPQRSSNAHYRRVGYAGELVIHSFISLLYSMVITLRKSCLRTNHGLANAVLYSMFQTFSAYFPKTARVPASTAKKNGLYQPQKYSKNLV